MKPFLKWAGGKTQLLPHILPLLPEQIATYHEPFLGGGAVFFALAAEGRFQRAILSDVNAELINCYRQIALNPEALMACLRELPIERDTFLRLRATKTASDVMGAARTIYLNKTCFNGLYRVNRSGQFNVPWGKHKNPALFDPDNLLACSEALRSAQLLALSAFEHSLLRDAEPYDAVYFDPPYVPLTPTSSFTAYSADRFGKAEQQQLARMAQALLDRNVFVLLSNSDTPLVRELYSGPDWDLQIVSARRAVNSKGTHRGPVNELLIKPSLKRRTVSEAAREAQTP